MVPGLPHSACSADQLEDFVFAEPLGQFLSEDGVGGGIGCVAERFVTDDEGQAIGRGQIFHLLEVLGTQSFFCVNCHAAEVQLNNKVTYLLSEVEHADLFDVEGLHEHQPMKGLLAIALFLVVL